MTWEELYNKVNPNMPVLNYIVIDEHFFNKYGVYGRLDCGVILKRELTPDQMWQIMEALQ